MGAGRKTSWLNRLRSELQRLRDDPNGFSSLGGDVLDACVREALRQTEPVLDRLVCALA